MRIEPRTCALRVTVVATAAAVHCRPSCSLSVIRQNGLHVERARAEGHLVAPNCNSGCNSDVGHRRQVSPGGVPLSSDCVAFASWQRSLTAVAILSGPESCQMWRLNKRVALLLGSTAAILSGSWDGRKRCARVRRFTSPPCPAPMQCYPSYPICVCGECFSLSTDRGVCWKRGPGRTSKGASIGGKQRRSHKPSLHCLQWPCRRPEPWHRLSSSFLWPCPTSSPAACCCGGLPPWAPPITSTWRSLWEASGSG